MFIGRENELNSLNKKINKTINIESYEILLEDNKFYVNIHIKNQIELLLLQNFCKKYNLNGCMDTELIKFLVNNPTINLYITYSPYCNWTLSETTSESKTFSEFCDYILKEEIKWKK